MRKRDKATGENGGRPAPDMGEWSELYPDLAEFLAKPAYDDGTPRYTGRLAMHTRGLLWVASLKDIDNDEFLQIEVPRPEDVFHALDELLRADLQPWQADPYPMKKPPQKKR